MSKKHKILIGILIILGFISVYVFWSFYQSTIQHRNLTHYEQYYPFLGKNHTQDTLRLTELNGNVLSLIYRNTLSNYLFQTSQRRGLNEKYEDGTEKIITKYFIYRLDWNGNILGSFEKKDDLNFYSGYMINNQGNIYVSMPYLVGKGVYSDWITNNQPQILHVPLSNKPVTIEQFRKIYHLAKAVFIFDYSSNVMVHYPDGRWEYLSLAFDPHNGSNGTNFKNKTESSTQYGKADNLVNMPYCQFTHVSQTIAIKDKDSSKAIATLSLDYFHKTGHVSAPLINIMGMTSYDQGIAFLTLYFKGKEFKFRTNQVKKYRDEDYTLSIDFQGNQQFIILDKRYLLN